MTTRYAQIATDDLRASIDYLEGLAVILAHLHQHGRETDNYDSLLPALEGMDSSLAWEPLRYQGIGTGWHYVGENVRELRERLLRSYPDELR